MTINIIALSDVHLRSTNPVARKDSLPKTQFKKLEFVFKFAERNDCIILQAGDFTDKARDWDLLIKLISFFRKYPAVKFYQVLGQHDNYFYSSTKGTTIGVLEEMGFINILNSHTSFRINKWNIWGSSWEESMPTPSSKLNNILVTHRSINPKQVYLYPGQKVIDSDLFLNKHKEYKLVIVGDIHRSFFRKLPGDRFIVNTGPMLRAEANNYNMVDHKPHFWHFKFEDNYVESVNKILIPQKESHHVLTRSHIQDTEDVDVDKLIELIENTSIGNVNRKAIRQVFNDKTVRLRIRNLMKEIYKNAKG